MPEQKILVITAKEADVFVNKYVGGSGIPARVHTCDSNVAALLTPETILDELSNLDLKEISLILLPGMIKGDVSIISRKLGIPCFKGTKNACDLEFLLPMISNRRIKLSTKDPADEVLAEEKRKHILKEIKEAYRVKKYTLKIGNKNPVYLGTEISHVVAEIPDAPLLSERELRKFAKYYVNSGANIVDIGMIANEDYSEMISGMIEILRKTVGAPLSIDTLNENEILSAVESGIDLILSIDETNYGVCDSINVPAVIIPRDKNENIPENAEDRIFLIEKIIRKLRNSEFDKVIVDPILGVPNLAFAESISAYIKFRKKHPRIPVLIGAGNVTEMIDTDSIGINALIAAIASELSVDLIFTTEASRKTKGSVGELARAVKMMYLSKKHKQPPKDLGIDLLYMKDKRDLKVIKDPREKGIKTVIVRKERESDLEDTEFRIYLTNRINVIYYKNKKPRIKFIGNSATAIYKEIISKNLIKNLDHAAYLGMELARVEIALKLGKNYVQDEDLFNK